METLSPEKTTLVRKSEMLALLRQKRIILARGDFWQFCLHYDYEFFYSRPFLQEVAEALQKLHICLMWGIAITVLIAMPPRAGKSYICSLFAAWFLGKWPELAVMRNTCTATLYDKFSYDTRSIIRTEKFTTIFPHALLAGDKQNLDGWSLSTARQVSYFGAGVGGTIIGFGANLDMTDDLYRSIEDALSTGYCERVNQWKSSAHDSRKEKNCPSVYIGTRWSKGDVSGQALERGVDVAVIIPALKNISVDAKGNITGDSFCENVKTTQEYIEIKKNTPDLIWEAEYMQNPIEDRNLLFPASELKLFCKSEFDATKDMRDVEYIMSFADPANKGGDFFSAPIGFVIGSDVYIQDIIYNTKGTNHTIGQTVELNSRYRTNDLIIEGNFGWAQVGAEIRELMSSANPECSVMIFKATSNKDTRILAQSAFIKNRFHFREDWATIPEYRAFMLNLMSYRSDGDNDHDDAPDSCAGLAFWLQRNIGHHFK